MDIYIGFGSDARKAFHVRPYDKHDVSSRTRSHVILLRAAASETCRRFTALSEKVNLPAAGDARDSLSEMQGGEREIERMLFMLSPGDESLLERAIAIEMLSVRLAVAFSERETDKAVKRTLDAFIADDFDHLYRFCNLADIVGGISVQASCGELTEIMPGRHTALQPAAAKERIRKAAVKKRSIYSILAVMTTAAVKRYAADFYTAACSLAKDRQTRALFAAIARIEQIHAAELGAIFRPPTDGFKRVLLQKYCECYLLFSCRTDEPDARFRKLYDDLLALCAGGFSHIVELAELCGKKQCEKVIDDGKLPLPVVLRDRADYVRSVLENMLSDAEADAHESKQLLRKSAAHAAVVEHIRRLGRDFRIEKSPHPVPRLRITTEDNF